MTRKLNFLLRKNQGKLLISKLKDDLSYFMSEKDLKDIIFLPLDISDNIREYFLDEFRKEDHKIITIRNINEISNVIVQNSQNFNLNENIHLSFSDSDKIGCINLNFGLFLRKVTNFIELDDENICIFNERNNKYIFVDKFIKHSKDYEFYYEIIIN